MPNLRPTEGPTLLAVRCVEFKAPCGWDDVGKLAEGYDYAMRMVYVLGFLIIGTELVVTRVRKNRGLCFFGIDATTLAFAILVLVKTRQAFEQTCDWHEGHRGMSGEAMQGWSIAVIVISWVAGMFIVAGQAFLMLPPE